MSHPSWDYDRALFAEQGLTSHLLFGESSHASQFDDEYLNQDLDFNVGEGEYDYLDDPEEVDDYEVQEATRGMLPQSPWYLVLRFL